MPVILISGNPEMAGQVPIRRFVLKPFALSVSIKAVDAAIGVDTPGG